MPFPATSNILKGFNKDNSSTDSFDRYAKSKYWLAEEKQVTQLECDKLIMTDCNFQHIFEILFNRTLTGTVSKVTENIQQFLH